MKVYYIVVHMCFTAMNTPVYDCTSFYWPEELSLKNCIKVLPIKAEEIEKNFEKQMITFAYDIQGLWKIN